MAAMSLSHSDSALGAFYRRMSGRMDKPRANTATAHKLARMVYLMLTKGETFVDQGQQRYEEQQRERSSAALKRRAAALGFQINPTQVPASNRAQPFCFLRATRRSGPAAGAGGARLTCADCLHHASGRTVDGAWPAAVLLILT